MQQKLQEGLISRMPQAFDKIIRATPDGQILPDVDAGYGWLLPLG